MLAVLIFHVGSGVVHVARVHVHIIALVVDEVCLMLVLCARVVVLAVVIAFPQPVSAVEGILFTMSKRMSSRAF